MTKENKKFFKTYKTILLTKKKDEISFFAKQAIRNYDKSKYYVQDQTILDSLLEYYSKPTKKGENKVDHAILDNYNLLNEREDEQEQADPVVVREPDPEPAQEEVQNEDNDEFIAKNKSALKRTLNLYDVKIKPSTDGLKPMEDDELNYSREQKRDFLRKRLQKGPFKVNTIMNSEMTSVKNPNQKI